MNCTFMQLGFGEVVREEAAILKKMRRSKGLHSTECEQSERKKSDATLCENVSLSLGNGIVFLSAMLMASPVLWGCHLSVQLISSIVVFFFSYKCFFFFKIMINDFEGVLNSL